MLSWHLGAGTRSNSRRAKRVADQRAVVRCVGAVLVLLLAGQGLSGCGGGGSPSAQHRPSGKLSLPLSIALPESVPMVKTVNLAQELLADSCMADQGFPQYRVPITQNTAGNAPNYADAPFPVVPVSQARLYGFHPSPTVAREQRQLADANTKIADYLHNQSAAWQSAFLRTLYGAAATRGAVRVGSSVMTYPTSGCIAWSAKQLYGDTRGLVVLRTKVQGLLLLSVELASSASLYQRKLVAWRHCASRRGVDYSNPEAAAVAANTAGPVASRREREIATVVSICIEDSGLYRSWVEVEAKEQQYLARRNADTVNG